MRCGRIWSIPCESTTAILVGGAKDDLPNDEIARPSSGSAGIPLLRLETPSAIRVPPGTQTNTRTGRRNIVRCLRDLAAERPDDVAFVQLLDGDTPQASLTYAQLDRRARAIAVCLQDVRLAGRNVVLAYPPGLEFIAAFFGALYAGCVAVPVYPPRARTLDRFHALIGDAGAPAGAQHRRHRRLYEDNQR